MATRRLVVLLALAIAGATCRRTAPAGPPPRPALGVVSVIDVTPPAEAPAELDRAQLERQLRDRLIATGLFGGEAGDGGAGPTTRARFEIGLDAAEVGDKGLARGRVRVRLETRPSGVPGAIDEQLDAQGEQPYPAPHGARHASARPDRAALFNALALRIAGDLISDFAARQRLHDGPPEAVHAALNSDAGELREEAIRVAGQRGLRQEVPTLLKLLSDPEESTRDAALGALIAMKERRAVSELTRTRSLRDRREMRKIIEAIAILGGQEAEDYLSFVAQTHDDDDIRAEAAAAKARLERRGADGPNRP